MLLMLLHINSVIQSVEPLNSFVILVNFWLCASRSHKRCYSHVLGCNRFWEPNFYARYPNNKNYLSLVNFNGCFVFLGCPFCDNISFLEFKSRGNSEWTLNFFPKIFLGNKKISLATSPGPWDMIHRCPHLFFFHVLGKII